MTLIRTPETAASLPFAHRRGPVLLAFLLLGLLFAMKPAGVAAQTVNGSFNTNIVGGQLLVDVFIQEAGGGTPDFGGGTFQFTYNNAALDYVSTAYSSFINSNSCYFKITNQDEGNSRVALAVTFDFGNVACTLGTYGTPMPAVGTNVATVTFDVVDPLQTSNLTWEIFEVQDDNGATIGNNTNASNDNSALPVELTSFEATRDGQSVVLRWATANETNNAGFEVEQARLADDEAAGGTARTWAAVTFVEGAGTTTAPRQYSRRVDGLEPGRYAFRLKQVDFDGAFAYSPEVEVDIEAPRTLALSPNYPNPFNPQTTIQFTVPADGKALLTVYNVLGQEVAVLFDGQALAGKQHEVTFEAGGLATGLYVYTLEHNGQRLSRSFMLMK